MDWLEIEVDSDEIRDNISSIAKLLMTKDLEKLIKNSKKLRELSELNPDCSNLKNLTQLSLEQFSFLIASDVVNEVQVLNATADSTNYAGSVIAEFIKLIRFENLSLEDIFQLKEATNYRSNVSVNRKLLFQALLKQRNNSTEFLREPIGNDFTILACNGRSQTFDFAENQWKEQLNVSF
ncbi:hypothetical protein Ciccas_014143 [Cichlidogyrus casuarinus]|uniref:Uncharacterized protein n=1 Tax=Cichlidogyrus casuarinus TaxID=1844966 RepID=A0ABD2PL15_9PLAT